MVRGDAPLRRLITHMSSHRKTVWLASTCSVVNRLFDLAPPVLIGAAVDVVVRGEDSVFPGQTGKNNNNFHFEDCISKVTHMAVGLLKQRVQNEN